ncbi:MAG: hypothetical protein RIT30_1478, partial [Bacteroidota bacterium]
TNGKNKKVKIGKVKSKIRKVYAKKNEPIGLILNYVLVGKPF